MSCVVLIQLMLLCSSALENSVKNQVYFDIKRRCRDNHTQSWDQNTKKKNPRRGVADQGPRELKRSGQARALGMKRYPVKLGEGVSPGGGAASWNPGPACPVGWSLMSHR